MSIERDIEICELLVAARGDCNRYTRDDFICTHECPLHNTFDCESPNAILEAAEAFLAKHKTPEPEPELHLCMDCRSRAAELCGIRYSSVIDGSIMTMSILKARAMEAYCGASAKHFKKKVPPIEKTHHNCKNRGLNCDDQICKTCGPEKKNWEMGE